MGTGAERRDGRAPLVDKDSVDKDSVGQDSTDKDSTTDTHDQAAGPDEPGRAGDGAADGTAAPFARPQRRRVAVLLGVAAFAYVLDVVTKLLVVAKLEGHDPIDLLGDWLQLRGTRNPGAAFGMGQAYTIVFSLIAATVVVVILRLSRRLYSVPWAIALGLLLGGAFGNLTDRIFRSPGFLRGHVVDFVAPKHFAVFNMADSAIVVGGCLIVLLSFLGLQPDGTREGDDTEDTGDTGDNQDSDDSDDNGGAGEAEADDRGPRAD
ncbi:signal peptidase II [Uniformispora flossi]|uniref:signal peptidase II n=1 Tax=Uniformispora flossi TaxID=3390723 RepID=UPI003C2E7955